MHPDILNEFIPDWQSDAPGASLGSLKCECTDEVQKVIKKSVKLCESPVELSEDVRKKVAVGIRMAIERDSIPWKPMPFKHEGGSLCNGANKLYMLRTEVKGCKPVELIKAKGMSKYDKNGKPLFGWNDFEAMHGDEPMPLESTQKQFRVGLAAYCRDGDGVMPVTIHEIPKKAFAYYDKGEILEDGRIVPWVI
jgi:hypothetical protein